MPNGVSNCTNLFIDDVKLLRKIRSEEDCKEMQKDINTIPYIYMSGVNHGRWNVMK